MGGRVQTIQFATIPGSPWSKARTRVGKGGRVYQEERDRTAEQVTALHLRKLTRQRGNVAIVAIFYRPDRHRIDADNLLKHVQDAGTGVVWDDDSQVTATAGIVEIDRDQPRTVLAVAAHVSTMRRGTDDITTCAGCGRPVPRPGGTRDRKTTCCSPECLQASRGTISLTALVPCENCGRRFRRRTRAQKLCGPDCRVQSMVAKKRSAAAPMSSCAGCGKELTHRRGGRCRECWKNNPRGGNPHD